MKWPKWYIVSTDTKIHHPPTRGQNNDKEGIRMFFSSYLGRTYLYFLNTASLISEYATAQNKVHKWNALTCAPKIICTKNNSTLHMPLLMGHARLDTYKITWYIYIGKRENTVSQVTSTIKKRLGYTCMNKHRLLIRCMNAMSINKYDDACLPPTHTHASPRGATPTHTRKRWKIMGTTHHSQISLW